MGFNLCGRVFVRAEGATCFYGADGPSNGPPIDAWVMVWTEGFPIWVEQLPSGNYCQHFPWSLVFFWMNILWTFSSIHVQKIRKAWVTVAIESHLMSEFPARLDCKTYPICHVGLAEASSKITKLIAEICSDWWMILRGSHFRTAPTEEHILFIALHHDFPVAICSHR